MNLYYRIIPKETGSASRICFLLFTTLFLLSVDSLAQRTCGTSKYMKEMIRSNPNIQYRMQMVEDQTKENVKSSLEKIKGNIVIPVVVHVVYLNPEQNIDDAQIRSQIKVLNEDFQRNNSDQNQTPAIFQAVAANAGIKFQLASRDPQGNPSTGITRKKTYKASFYTNDNDVKYTAMGGVDAWPTDQYLNIWVCNLGLGILGYSQFPGGPTETDGVVIGYKFFGSIGNLKAPFNLGRTTTHELGHWLNLRHIWGDGPCGVDDLVPDTPASDAPNQGCSFGHSSCGSVNMTQNFMDYTDDVCMNLFTKGQAKRMRALFAVGGHRHSLLNSLGIEPEEAPIAESKPILFSYPEDVNVADLSANSAFLSWTDVSIAEKYLARLRRKGKKDWSPRKFDKTYINATGLKSCTEYELQLASVVGKKTSPFSPIFLFKTEGCLVEESLGMRAPRGLRSQLNAKQVKISWQGVSGAVAYKVQYKIAGYKGIKSQVVSSKQLIIPNIRSGVRYLYRVRAHFEDSAGPWSEVRDFRKNSSSIARLAETSEEVPFMRVQNKAISNQVKILLDVKRPIRVRIAVRNEKKEAVKSYGFMTLEPGRGLNLNVSNLVPGNYYVIITDEDAFEYKDNFSKR